MNDDAIQDLKQFISAELHQQTSDIRGDISELKSDVSTLKSDVRNIDKKVDDLSDAVATAINDSNQAHDDMYADHESRITKLEQKTA